jgi:hypothetical protein
MQGTRKDSLELRGFRARWNDVVRSVLDTVEGAVARVRSALPAHDAQGGALTMEFGRPRAWRKTSHSREAVRLRPDRRDDALENAR